MKIVIGTAHGIYIFEQSDQGWHETGGELLSQHVTSVAAQGHNIKMLAIGLIAAALV